jgi:hypothetical protein
MRFFGVFVAGLVYILAAPAVQAETITVSREIHVRAVVLPARTIVTDQHGQIVKIISNTPVDVLPAVYRGQVAKGSQQVLTKDIYSQYKRLLAHGSPGIGVLYQRQDKAAAQFQRPKILLATNSLSLWQY